MAIGAISGHSTLPSLDNVDWLRINQEPKPIDEEVEAPRGLDLGRRRSDGTLHLPDGVDPATHPQAFFADLDEVEDPQGRVGSDSFEFRASPDSVEGRDLPEQLKDGVETELENDPARYFV